MKNMSGLILCFLALIVFGTLPAEDAGIRPGSVLISAGNKNSGDVNNERQLRFWTYTDELKKIIDDFYLKSHPDVSFDFSFISSDRFVQSLDAVLATGKEVPDLITLEASFLRKYVESGKLMDISDIAKEAAKKQLAYPVDFATHNGKVYALTWQAAPGALYYRRSLAKKYLGTDDPEKVQAMLSDFDGFMKTAELLGGKSKGKCLITVSPDDIFTACVGARKGPWVVDGKISVDPAMEKYMDMAGTLTEKGYVSRYEMWSEAWFDGMKDRMTDSNGKPAEVFCYLFPGWGLHYVLKQTARDTSGDWAMIEGPSPYFWGGSWVGIYNGTEKAEQARAFLRYMVIDNTFAAGWAEYSGDFISNRETAAKIKKSYSEPYLGGQNHYAAFLETAGKVNGKLGQPTDRQIESLFLEAVGRYVNGTESREKALESFRKTAAEKLGL